MKQTDRIYCIPGDHFPANFILSAFADANAELPVDAPNIIVVIPDEKGNMPGKFNDAIIDLAPCQAFLLSSSAVYGEEYIDVTEDSPLSPETAIGRTFVQTERDFTSRCAEAGIIATILRLPLLIGTGMTGEMRRRVNAIYRAIYRHINGVEAHQSVLHARDLPQLITKLKGYHGIYNVSDHTDPTTYEIAEAISARLGAKRIYTVNAKWARITARFADMLGLKDLGTSYLRSVTATRTISTARLSAIIPSWCPTDATSFLQSHSYSPLDP